MDSTTSTPRPDPTVLTTQQLIREIASVSKEIGCTKEILEARLNGNEKVYEEKFAGIDRQFVERDVRTEQTSKDRQLAVDSAFQAAKEAVEKTEASFTKQLDQLQVLLQQTAKSSDEKIGDLKDRISTIENRRAGMNEGWGYLAGVVGTLIAIAAVVVAFVKG